MTAAMIIPWYLVIGSLLMIFLVYACELDLTHQRVSFFAFCIGVVCWPLVVAAFLMLCVLVLVILALFGGGDAGE